MPLFSTLYLLFFFSLFLPSVVRAPCFSRSRPLPRGPIQPLLLCSYYQAHGSRPNRKLGIYALFQIDLLYLILTPVAHSCHNSPSRGSTLLREPFFFFFFDRSISTGVPAARTLSSFFLSIPKEFLFVGGGEITGIDRSPRDNASIPFFVSRFLSPISPF